MARYQRDFHADAEGPLSMDELVQVLGADADDPEARRHAIACYLSAGDGWREALKALHGAFAEDGAGLRGT